VGSIVDGTVALVGMEIGRFNLALVASVTTVPSDV
jgi:hypothetical protein